MRIAILGAAGFIGTNLTIKLAKDNKNQITAVDEKKEYFSLNVLQLSNVVIKEMNFQGVEDYYEILKNQDVVYHLVSTNNPATSNLNIGREITDNIQISIHILEACVVNHVKKIIFISSGGTVYGKVDHFPISENALTNPITTYGIQKLTIEKLLYLYKCVHNLDYAIVRLSNPYGPYQRPNGKLGVVTTFVYRAINNLPLVVYGDGDIVRDYIYIDNAIDGIIGIANANSKEQIFNLGSGQGISVNEIIQTIQKVFERPLKVEYIKKRSVDVPVNILDMSRYKKEIGKLSLVSLEEGIIRTKDFFWQNEQEKK